MKRKTQMNSEKKAEKKAFQRPKAGALPGGIFLFPCCSLILAPMLGLAGQARAQRAGQKRRSTGRF